MFIKNKGIIALAVAGLLTTGSLLTGCGSEQQGGARSASVKAMQVLEQDTPLAYEYAGQIVGRDEVQIRARVSGNIVEKYITGGQKVTAGQPLYRIDSRQYESAVLQAQATLGQSEAVLNNARLDLYRYQQLLEANAIAEQTVTTQQANVRSYEATVAANAALLRKAQEDLSDTVVYAPISGQLSVDDVAAGTFVTAGSTTLVTMGTADPIYVQFSISESEYLALANDPARTSGAISSSVVELTLSNGEKYNLTGQIVEADRALADQTGTLTLKALFNNPTGILLPGMFARVRILGEVVPNAILVPERAVQQLLGKSFVMVVGKDNKSEARTIELGAKVGSYYIAKSGLAAGDVVIVEGLTTLQEGMDLNVTVASPEELGFSIEGDSSIFNTSKLTPVEK